MDRAPEELNVCSGDRMTKLVTAPWVELLWLCDRDSLGTQDGELSGMESRNMRARGTADQEDSNELQTDCRLCA
jgi:hypothetical protein